MRQNMSGATGASPAIRDDGTVTVTVAVPTFRRPDELRRLLPAILAQVEQLDPDGPAGGSLPPLYRIDVLVVDNDSSCTGAAAVREVGSPRVHYVVEPNPGIAAVRDRALRECRSDLLVSIDDDEWPHSGWLAALLATWQQYRPAIVFGKVVAVFQSPLDPWLRAGGFFARFSLPTGTVMPAAAAGNWLLDVGQIRRLGVVFHPDFGLTGGEDTLFSREVVVAGGRIVWCDESVADDLVPAVRMTRAWVRRRCYSHGNTRSLVAIRLSARSGRAGPARVGAVVRGLARLGVGSGRVLVGLVTGSLAGQAGGCKTLWTGTGMVTGALGIAFQEYRRPQPETAPLRVLQSFPGPLPTTNPYLVQLGDRLSQEPGVQVLTFTWQRALLARFDVFHVHWPETLVGGRRGPKKAVRQLLSVLLLLRLRLGRKPVVRTVHNLELPRDISRVERALLRWFDAWTTLRIRVNDLTPLPAGLSATIPHGHYADWFARWTPPEPIPGRLVFFGFVRRYKNVLALIEAFRATADLPGGNGLSLRVAGLPSTQELAESIREATAGDPRITLRFEFYDDAELVREVGGATAVVLPYTEMHNSAGVLTAVSLARPVLAPDNELNRKLAEQVGPGWIQLFDPPLKAQHLVDLLARLKDAPPSAPPDLSSRDWRDSAADHVRAYRSAMGALRPGTVVAPVSEHDGHASPNVADRKGV